MNTLNKDKVTPSDIKDNIKSVKYFNPTGTLTLCVITLKNGFMVTGESACVDPKNFDADLGKELAFQQAHSKAWGFMGYHLTEVRYQESKVRTYKDRVRKEASELAQKIQDLAAYLSGSESSLLLKEDRTLMEEQLSVMRDYANILTKRMDRF